MSSATQPIGVIARLLDLSERRVQQLSREGVIPKAERGQYDLIGSVRGYVRYLRDQALKAQAGAPDYAAERARFIRARARQFIGMLRGLAINHHCAVVMLAHPSLHGMTSGTGTSGSTGWNNSVRSRLYLSRVRDKQYEPNPDARVLSVMKSNYSRAAGEIALTWQNGVFVADTPVTGLDRMAASAKAERVFLTLLRMFAEQGRTVNHAGGQTYAPTVFASHPKSEGMTRRALKAAMDALLMTGKIRIAQSGPPSKRRAHLEVAE